MPQPQTGQLSPFNDFHMLQQHIMLKQLQEPQMQQQFQELGDARQQNNYLNQQSMMNKQVLGPRFPPLIDQKPIQDSSHMFQVQGFSNALAFSQDQSEPLAVSSYESSVPSNQDVDYLDPLEQKILFNMDDNSGSWSALMQSAVAETTSSNTGLHEEWSGLSYQNPDLSTSNQPSNFVDNHNSWADDNLQSASSLCSNPELLFNNSSNSSFSGFHQLGTQISFKQEDGLQTDMSQKSFQQSPKNCSSWLDYTASSCIDPNGTGETSQHMFDVLHNANKSTVSSARSQSPQEAFAVMASRFSDSTPASSQNCTNSLDRQFPFLGSNSAIQLSSTSGLSFTSSPPDVWPNIPSQQNSSDVEPQVKLDFEAFGRSLRPSHLPPENYSLLNQLNPVKNENTDQSMGPEKHSSYHQQPLKALSQSGSQCNSTNSNVTSNITGQSDIRLQMAPTWFNHYGTLKNERVLSMLQKEKAAENTAQHFFVGKPLGFLNSSMMQVKSFDDAVTNSASPDILTPNVTDQNPSVLRPKKRKFGLFEFLPWHKAVIQGSQGFQNTSTAELVWAKAVNRLVEKVDHEAQIVEAIRPPKKRLVLTTQLMQQLFQPLPDLLGDATKNCFSAAYFAARLALADACSLTSYNPTPSNISNMSFEKPKSSERISDHYFLKSAEDFTNRSKWLEELLLSLDDRVCISDIRVESQELDKFSVINRLAKVHRRGPPAGAESSTTTGPNTQRMFLQRYVIAHPMPRKLPEGTKCTSL